MNARVMLELSMLEQCFPKLVAEGPWICIREYALPATVWAPDTVDLAFVVPPGYPHQAPYGFYVRPLPELLSGEAVGSTRISTDPPFGDGQWLKFSWQPTRWVPGPEPQAGTNILHFAHSISERLEQGS